MTAVFLVALCLLASAFFSAAEMAFIAANRIRLRHLAEQGSRVARGYMEAFQQPERLLSTAMMGVTIAHVSASALTTALLLPWLDRKAALWATVILTPVMLVFGEILPKTLTQQRATAVALQIFDPLRGAAWLLAPIVWVANRLVGALLQGLGYRERRDPFVSRGDLRLLFQVEPQGTTDVKEEEREMIEGIFDLGETTVREIMVPLVDVVAVPEEATVEEAVSRIRESGHSRLPVYRERIDHVIGIVTALDVLHRGATEEGVKPLLRPAYYVPETKRIDDLLREMQRQRIQLAVVVDEYGGSEGIVSVEDIVEEIVGEIEDEHERQPSTLTSLPDGSYLVAARMGIDELNEALEWDVPKKDYETVGGLILSALGRIPRPGEQVILGRYELSVVDADERRILKVKVKAREQARADERSGAGGT
ncbi:MAG: HlyC/CorC family transporter [Candidatus Rokubacteria bacterium]|nr:HlyC/CorC family transporter [Candidatus Rokubacteria bacterium]